MIAETDDDLSTLTLPPEESSFVSPPTNDVNPCVYSVRSPDSQGMAHSSSNYEDKPLSKASERPFSRSIGDHQKQAYPLYPSITQLLHEKNIPVSDADKIPASGPKGRLLKGDVLAYIGRISSSYPSEQSIRLSRLGRLDLSNIKLASPPQTSSKSLNEAESQQMFEIEPTVTKVTIPISLSTVLSVQNRIRATLGVMLPLSTFLARATEMANQNLPRPATAKPTSDELFNSILGLDRAGFPVPKGGYSPQITSLPVQPLGQMVGPQKPIDIYDILTAKAFIKSDLKGKSQPPGIMAESGAGEAMNAFSVTAERGEEKRARVFLERMKTILQTDPEKLIL